MTVSEDFSIPFLKSQILLLYGGVQSVFTASWWIVTSVFYHLFCLNVTRLLMASTKAPSPSRPRLSLFQMVLCSIVCQKPVRSVHLICQIFSLSLTDAQTPSCLGANTSACSLLVVQHRIT